MIIILASITGIVLIATIPLIVATVIVVVKFEGRHCRDGRENLTHLGPEDCLILGLQAETDSSYKKFAQTGNGHNAFSRISCWRHLNSPFSGVKMLVWRS